MHGYYALHGWSGDEVSLRLASTARDSGMTPGQHLLRSTCLLGRVAICTCERCSFIPVRRSCCMVGWKVLVPLRLGIALLLSRVNTVEAWRRLLTTSLVPDTLGAWPLRIIALATIKSL